MMQIRPFEAPDEGAVIALWSACGLTVPNNDPAKDVARKLKVLPELFLVGEVGGDVVASVMGGYDGHRGWVHYLAVHPDHQRGGYGRRLMTELENSLISMGCTESQPASPGHQRRCRAVLRGDWLRGGTQDKLRQAADIGRMISRPAVIFRCGTIFRMKILAIPFAVIFSAVGLIFPATTIAGEWITDKQSGCKVWWTWDPQPFIAAEWSGSCKNGLAEGGGGNHVEQGGHPVRSL